MDILTFIYSANLKLSIKYVDNLLSLLLILIFLFCLGCRQTLKYDINNNNIFVIKNCDEEE